MTLQNTLRIASVLAIVAILPALGLAGSDDTTVAYLEGTIKDVPAETTGELDLTDSENLHFRYGDISYAIPFESLTSYKWGRPTEGFGEGMSHSASKVGRTFMPMLYDGKFLTIRFKAGDDPQQMVFAVPKKMVSATDPILATWVKHNHETRAKQIVAGDEGSWWGNRYWKTKRNKDLWDEAQQESTKPRGEATVASRDEE